MTLTLIALLAALGVAYANGANDNFKGVATLLGSGTAEYRGALLWGTLTTLLGSLAAVWLASQLVQAFRGRGLVPDSMLADPCYLAAVALGAAATVLLATWRGMPISTTHALVGGLVGAALAAKSGVHLGTLAGQLLGPLLVTPLLALAVTVALYRGLHTARRKLGVVEETCFCLGRQAEPVAMAPGLSPQMAVVEVERLRASWGTEVTCRRRYRGAIAGIQVGAVLDRLHYLSAGLVSFARGLNDTPKIAALLIAGAGLSGPAGLVTVGLVMAAGGWLAARRVAETMSHKITPMNAGQGLTANLVTASIVIAASRWGLPVSTTHVSCGGLFGVGTATAEARWGMIGRIVASWLITLPLAAALSAALYPLLRGL